MKEITLHWEDSVLIYYSDNKKYKGLSTTCLSSFLYDLIRKRNHLLEQQYLILMIN